MITSILLAFAASVFSPSQPAPMDPCLLGTEYEPAFYAQPPGNPYCGGVGNYAIPPLPICPDQQPPNAACVDAAIAKYKAAYDAIYAQACIDYAEAEQRFSDCDSDAIDVWDDCIDACNGNTTCFEVCNVALVENLQYCELDFVEATRAVRDDVIVDVLAIRGQLALDFLDCCY
jgi:hypothetical protein